MAKENKNIMQAEFNPPVPLTEKVLKVVENEIKNNSGKKYSTKKFDQLIVNIKAAAWDSGWKKVVVAYERWP